MPRKKNNRKKIQAARRAKENTNKPIRWKTPNYSPPPIGPGAGFMAAAMLVSQVTKSLNRRDDEDV